MDNIEADSLIARVGNGDMTALERLYDELSDMVYILALSITRNTELSKDVMQDTFVRVHKYAKSFKPGGFGKAWVLKIARNLALTALKQQAKSVQLSETISCTGSTEEDVLARELLEHAMNTLGDIERQVVMLHASEGLTMEEIARVMGCPAGTVKWRHAGALKKLRSFFEDKEAAK